MIVVNAWRSLLVFAGPLLSFLFKKNSEALSLRAPLSSASLFLSSHSAPKNKKCSQQSTPMLEVDRRKPPPPGSGVVNAPNRYRFTSSGCFEYKRCIFSAHITKVGTRDEAYLAHSELLKLFPEQTYGPMAYKLDNGNMVEDLDKKSFFDDFGDIGIGEKLQFLLDRFNAVNCLLVVTRETAKAFIPESLGVRKFKFAVSAAKNALDAFRASVTTKVGGIPLATDPAELVMPSSTESTHAGSSIANGRDGSSSRVAMKYATSLISQMDLPAVKRAEKWGRVNNFRNTTPRDGEGRDNNGSNNDSSNSNCNNPPDSSESLSEINNDDKPLSSAAWLRAEIANSRGVSSNNEYEERPLVALNVIGGKGAIRSRDSESKAARTRGRSDMTVASWGGRSSGKSSRGTPFER